MVYIILGNGFEEIEAIAPCDILRRGDVDVAFAGVGGKTVIGAHGITFCADVTVEEIQPEMQDMVVLPGGMGGVHAMKACPAVLEVVSRAWSDGKYVAAICAAPTILAGLGITDGRKATCYPGLEGDMGAANMIGLPVVRDGNLICGQAPGAAIPFGLELLAVMKGTETMEKVKAGLVLPGKEDRHD